MPSVRPAHCTQANKSPQTWLTKHIDGRNYYICNDCHKQTCKEDKAIIDKIYKTLNPDRM